MSDLVAGLIALSVWLVLFGIFLYLFGRGVR